MALTFELELGKFKYSHKSSSSPRAGEQASVQCLVEGGSPRPAVRSLTDLLSYYTNIALGGLAFRDPVRPVRISTFECIAVQTPSVMVFLIFEKSRDSPLIIRLNLAWVGLISFLIFDLMIADADHHMLIRLSFTSGSTPGLEVAAAEWSAELLLLSVRNSRSVSVSVIKYFLCLCP